MAVDMFLDIEGVKGESQDKAYKDKIAVLSWSWGETNQGAGAFGTGHGTGKVSMQDFHFVMRFCCASPVLMLACANGKHFGKAVLTCRKAGEKPVEYLKVTFTDCIISSYQTGASGGGGDEYPTDSISFNYSKIEMEYKLQTEKGQVGDPVRSQYNLKENA